MQKGWRQELLNVENFWEKFNFKFIFSLKLNFKGNSEKTKLLEEIEQKTHTRNENTEETMASSCWINKNYINYREERGQKLLLYRANIILTSENCLESINMRAVRWATEREGAEIIEVDLTEVSFRTTWQIPTRVAHRN